MRAKTEISIAIDECIETIEAIMQAQKKHVLKTETLIDMVLAKGLDLSDDDENREILLKAGFGQFIQKRLQNRNYRMVRSGYFVRVDICMNESYLIIMLENQDIAIKEKEVVKKRLEELKKIRFPSYSQLTLFQDENENLVIYEPKTESQFLTELIADAV